MLKLFFCLLTVFGIALNSSSQSVNHQLWFEYMLNKPIGKSFNIENAFTVSTLLNTPRWWALDYSLAAEWTANKHLDVMGQFIISYTKQTESYNTLELRPLIGARVHLTPDKRILTRALFRLELRNFNNLSTGEWTHAVRPRLRVEALMPINKTSFSHDKVWYGIADFEMLGATNDVEERFANRIRGRIGAGYKLNSKFRFELIFMGQRSRNGINDAFSSTDNILRFRLKQFLVKPKPKVAEETTKL